MMIAKATMLNKFWPRCGLGILALMILTTGANAEEAAKLDANGRKIYEALLDSSPPMEIENDGTGFGLKLLRVSGHPRYEKGSNNGSIAEVIYDFKPPTGTDVLRIDFLIYPDSKSANRRISEGIGKVSILMSGMSEGDMGTELHWAANETFEKEQVAEFAKSMDNDKASISFAYQIDRIIIISQTDAKFPGVVIRDSDQLGKLADNQAKDMIYHARLLLAFAGKDVLDQPEIKTLLH